MNYEKRQLNTGPLFEQKDGDRFVSVTYLRSSPEKWSVVIGTGDFPDNTTWDERLEYGNGKKAKEIGELIAEGL